MTKESRAVPFVLERYELLGNFKNIDTLLPEPFGEVGPEDPDLLETPRQVNSAYPLELGILRFGDGG